MITQREAIANFLDDVSPGHEYTPDMEVQVIVSSEGGERVTGEYQDKRMFAYEDEDGNRWSPFRIPYQSWADPEYQDRKMDYDLSRHADAIGLTGFDWVNKRSRWVAYDFDAIVGHSERHVAKLSPTELQELKVKAEEIPWVTVKSSTSGNGLHLYVYIDDNIEVKNHTEHAAIARAILHKMSGLVGFDFSSRVDTCGGNMWVWARRQTSASFEILKQGDKLSSVPTNWREHLQVTGNKRKKVSYGRSIDKLVTETDFCKFDDDHLKVIKWLEAEGRLYWYDADHHMVITHVGHLVDAHKALKLIGVFDTVSPCTDLNTPNCFMYPQVGGAWVVRRYGKGTKEHDSWDQDGVSWTKCHLNKLPSLDTFCRSFNAVEDPAGGHVFSKLSELQEALKLLKIDLEVPTAVAYFPAKLKRHKDNQRLVVEVEAPGAAHLFKGAKGWLVGKRDKASCVIGGESVPASSDSTSQFDDSVRHVITINGVNAGWCVYSGDSWNNEPLEHVKMVLENQGFKNAEIRRIIGGLILNPWKLVVLPFQSEYPGDRQWNRNAPRFRFEPQQGSYPRWQEVFNHLGNHLTPAVLDDEWCQKAEIRTGGEYLFYWVASLIQYPLEPLPYLFIYGDKQGTGKSTFHEALRLLFEGGVEEANTALSETTFNGELEGCVLCYVEEVDLQRSKRAYNKIKNWVTADRISIHPKGSTPYMTPNATHWVQTANDRSYCPVFPNDTRITYVQVNDAPEVEIPKSLLFDELTSQGPAILDALLKLQIPPSSSRLRIPVLATDDKKQAIRQGQSDIERFYQDNVYEITGRVVTLAEFKAAFHNYLEDDAQRRYWTNPKINEYMTAKCPKGIFANKWSWGNISLQSDLPEEDFELYTDNQQLKKRELISE